MSHNIQQHVVEYYLDEHLTKRLPVNELGLAIVDWGETTPGMKKERLLYIKNLTHDKLTLRQPSTEDSDMKITDFPTRLLGKEYGKVMLEFTPHLTRIKPLNTNWSFEIVIG